MTKDTAGAIMDGNGNGSPIVAHPRITSDPNVMLGKPCIRGTRITVELILRWLSEGRTFAELLEAYPHISEDDIKAALAYAADMVSTRRPEAAE